MTRYRLFWLFLLLILLWGAIALIRPLPVLAQSGCALRINEIMYDPASGTGAAARAEWVELFVAQDIAADTTFYMTDFDAVAVGVFNKVFTVPAGTVAGSYIVVNNDGDPANDGQSSSSGIYTTLSFFMGNASTKLLNTGDGVAVYVGSDTNGTPCDYAEYLGGDTGVPPGFSWNAGCTPSSSAAFGVSISLDLNGAASNSGCDWAESGQNSPNDPGLPLTGSPHTKGWSNNTTPTAVSLAAFGVTLNADWLAPLLVGMLGMVTAVSRRKRPS